ncbi:IS1595 family transposase [Algoriphagus halophytocola]|uniref:IS1595 family transposase n=1 Tax=Algoriphagus halophytocola TaxID=2991499 RepID=A0ABY6MHE3_9BACT|nr:MULTISPECIES: IS1595 family transposase [unclassified Algoriphagus]UZD21594.1 IS1595 family transposase [Algoriphagus sp. TR-M5]WBL42806.1 IS1595 family transposase [Algoriphagus sp. TR-M9]
MDIFKGQGLIEFSKRFQSELDCKKYLAELKWKDGFTCRKCGHLGSQTRKDYARTCNKCSDTESAGAGTLFHKVKFGLVKAFYICFEMSTSTKSLSAMYMAKRYEINRKTAMSFMHKVREAMKSSGNHPMKGEVHVDEFVVGGQEAGHTGRSYGGKKKKVVCAVELTGDGKVKRFYALQIKDFSAKSLRPIFESHIDRNAQVQTDEWKGYRTIKKDFAIKQVPSELGLNFKTIHTMIHQLKSWLRTTFSWVSKRHIDRYLCEFSYRINRSQNKETIFHNLITRMVSKEKIYIADLI